MADPYLVTAKLLLLAVIIGCIGGSEYQSSLPPSTTQAPNTNIRHIYAEYTAHNTTRLSHMVVDKTTGRLFVAGVNRLIQLNAALDEEIVVVTGPKNDSPLCHARGCDSSDTETTITNNINKVLVLDPESRTLITCGSLFQGACSKYKISNISVAAETFEKSIAANDNTSSTYAFIGPENYNNRGRTNNVLYVGTTFTNNGDYRHDVPAISSRNLHTLDLAEISFFKESQLKIDVKYRDHFLVKYVYGFNASEFSYFVIVQRQSHLQGDEIAYVSRLARTCINDGNYDTYTEVSLQCFSRDMKTNYTLIQDAKVTRAGTKLSESYGYKPGELILVGVFSPSKNGTSEAEASSALCAFSLRDIEAKFDENIHTCFNGTERFRNMEYISGAIDDGKCPNRTSGNVANFCEAGLKISGRFPIVSKALIQFDGTPVSSITMATTEQHTVAFLGTRDGRLKKVLLSNSDIATEYEEVLLDPGHAILPDTTIDKSGDFLYVLSTSKVLKVKVEHCSSFGNCSSCLEAKNPYCGWCSLEKRCTIRKACQKATDPSPRWLALGTGRQCIDFEQVKPDRIPINQMTTVELYIRTLPGLPQGAKYKCVFGGAEPIDASLTDYGLTCTSPPIEHRPMIPEDSDHIRVPLSVRSSETNKDFVSRNFAYYNCSRHTTCRECVKSQWACNWCIHDNKCTHDANSCHQPIIYGENESILHILQQNPTHFLPRGANSCPRIVHDGTILLPHNVEKEIVLKVENLPPNLLDFRCIVTIEGAHMMVNARADRGNRYIICDKSTYRYNADTGEYQASVTVVWNENHHIDTVNVILYKCDILGSHREHPDCSLCITRNSKYQCTWCGNTCSYNETCSFTPVSECPKPRIDLIKPLSGPIEGGTLVTIEGSNLGLKEEDIRGKIHIGQVPCELVNYEVSVKIQCRSGSSETEIESPVIVGNKAGFTESVVHFSYKDVKLEGIGPKMGPSSGGTQIALSGKHLNIGSSVMAYLDDMPCQVNMSQASSSSVTCTTSKSPDGPQNIQSLTLIIDNANRTLNGNCFNYTQDPTILEIKPLKSFASGGRMITVHGENLDTIQKPEMFVYFDELDRTPINKSICSVINRAQMECPSPSINLKYYSTLRSKRDAESKRPTPKFRETLVTFKVGFIMDNVDAVRDLENNFQSLRSVLTYVEDPKFFEFPNLNKLYKGDTLVIEGENLNLASDESDVNVTIGTKACNVTSLALTQLVCTPPDVQPAATDELGIRTDTNLPLVVVRVGQSLRFPIGYLRYEVMKSYNFPDEASIGIAIGTVFLVFLFAAVLIVYRRKSTQAEREYKRIQIQMDTLESNVRSECKQAFTQMCTWDPRRNGSHAFAELQTDMTDLTADLESSGIPTLDHKTYVMKVFFPGVSDHPILNDPKSRNTGPRTNYDAAMLQFDQLINNKGFLLAFIDTLEAQKSFNIRDKVNVASLLMIVLMGKMEYATEVLRCLLIRLSVKSGTTKYPQLMLRRTESVVEKMLTNWMALCMYNYLKEYAGSSLFLLFKAIKYQIEKGPVDAVTHDARYSLSEERLLREQIEHGVVTIHLVQEDPHYEKIPYQTYQTLHVVQDDLDEKIQCKVLDCDTISQVKLKILDALYKNTPFSLRPSIHEVDLEWRHGRGGHLTLQDEDLTTKSLGGWKKLNTLAHYGVKESAVMSLIPRQNDSFNSNCKQPCQNCTGTYLTNSLSPIITTNGDIESGSNSKNYHLVKHMDDHSSYANNKSSSAERTHKAIPEIFLTRLLSTKGTIQKFVDDFFTTILTANEALPPAIKWLFDLLDDAAVKNGIADPEVVHAWKSNSLPLRFWVNFIKNPDFIFDINKTTTVDACLSVIAQTLMDSCSTSEHRLGKDSPSNKLLFAKDIPHYREMVSRFYCDVQMLPQITDQEMSTAMQQLSVSQLGEFDVVSALKELYIYVTKYSEQIFETLETDPYCKKMHLAHKLENVACTLEGEETSTC